MSVWETRAFNALMVAVTITGVAYLWMKYGLQTDDPFALVNHPWEPSMLAGHVLSAPVAMLAFGMLFRSHVLQKLLSNRRPARRSGWTSLGSFAAMCASGYALQVVSDPSWLGTLVWLHVGASVLFVVGYGAHLVIGWRLPARMRELVARPRPGATADGSP